jgi:hypothetical protein
VIVSYSASFLLGVSGISMMLSDSVILSGGIVLFLIITALVLGFYLKKIDMTL